MPSDFKPPFSGVAAVATDTQCDRITATIPEFRRLSGIGRSRIYQLLDADELESVHVGARRLILIDSYRRLIERQRAAAGRTAQTIPRGSRDTATTAE